MYQYISCRPVYSFHAVLTNSWSNFFLFYLYVSGTDTSWATILETDNHLRVLCAMVAIQWWSYLVQSWGTDEGFCSGVLLSILIYEQNKLAGAMSWWVWWLRAVSCSTIVRSRWECPDICYNNFHILCRITAQQTPLNSSRWPEYGNIYNFTAACTVFAV